MVVQPDAFEAVKNNMCTLFGKIVNAMAPTKLDLLFRKFERCTGWGVPDVLRIIDMLRGFAKMDEKACS